MVRLCTLLILICSLFLSLWRAYPSTLLQVIVCDVGQGDGIILMYGSFQMIIDAGLSADVMLECISDHLPIWDRFLEYVVFTHADADHIGGMSAVLDRYRVGVVFANPTEKDTQLARSVYTQLAELAQVERLIWNSTQWLETITIDQTVSLQILSPPEVIGRTATNLSSETETMLSAKEGDGGAVTASGKTSENDRSIAIYVQMNSFSILLTGDLECPGEIALLQRGVTKPVNVLKVGHHGAKTSTCQPFLDKIQPENAIVSAGKNNRYKHPSLEVMNNLIARGVRIWRTDQLGSVVITSDGTDYWLRAHPQ